MLSLAANSSLRFTCSANGCRVQPPEVSDLDEKLLHQGTDAFTCMALFGEYLLVGSEDRCVYLYKIEDSSKMEVKFEKIFCRVQLAVRALDVSPLEQDRIIAVASDFQKVKILDFPFGKEVLQLGDHSSAVLCVKFNHDGRFLVSSYPYLIPRNRLRSCIFIDKTFITLDTDVCIQSVIDWQANDTILWIASFTGGLGYFDLKEKRLKKYEVEHIKCSAVCKNSKDNLLAIVHQKSTIVLNLKTRKRILEEQVDVEIAALAWDYDQENLLLADPSGNIRTLPVKPVSMETSKEKSSSKMIDDEAENDDTSETIDSESESNQESGSDLEGFIDDGNQVDIDDSDADLFDESVKLPPKLAPSKSLSKKQFQPNSTIWKNGRRYLTFNLTGFVIAFRQEADGAGGQQSIKVGFHDKGEHRGFTFTDRHQFDLASMGKDGVAFATHAKVSFKSFESWTKNIDWEIQVPDEEMVKLIAVGTSRLAIFTSERILRFFTLGGAQVGIVDFSSLVTMAAQDDFLLLVTENSEVYILNMVSLECVNKSRLPMPLADVSWIGFTDKNNPCVYAEKSGIVLILKPTLANQEGLWVRIFEDSKGGEEIWPVGILESQLMYLPATTFVPVIVMDPILKTIKLRVPLISTSTEETSLTKLEEEIFRNKLLVPFSEPDENALAEDKNLLILIQYSLKGDRPNRALDYAKLMHTRKALESAAKLSQAHNVASLTAKIYKIIEDRFENVEIDSPNFVSTTYNTTKSNSKDTPPPITAVSLVAEPDGEGGGVDPETFFQNLKSNKRKPVGTLDSIFQKGNNSKKFNAAKINE